ncbi:hypothetical protein AB0M46_09500 [Dactylosporangium sp. NPDC051485]|uniref:type IV toxin-antitoxin system AbiEi family antitoxin domain-containing protein n=1 Tax=Dactylosporangium sp. NPDC051485 TaxID=3154846 RepID=UPI003422908F
MGPVHLRQADGAGLAWTTVSRLARDGRTEHVAHGVYRFRGSPVVDDLAVRAAWLQLAPGTPAWERTPDRGVVTHRSAAALYRIGHLPADTHEFALPGRRQSRRQDVRLHRLRLAHDEVRRQGGLLVSSPSRTAADLLRDLEDPGAVGECIADALRRGLDTPAALARRIAPSAARFGLPRGAGEELLGWLLELTAAPERATWLAEAHQSA